MGCEQDISIEKHDEVPQLTAQVARRKTVSFADTLVIIEIIHGMNMHFENIFRRS